VTEAIVLEEEQRADRFTELVERLSHQSVVKHFDAYADVPWDDPAYAIDPTDPRWELSAQHPLGATEWYRSLPDDVRARIGLHSIVANMKAGLQFESILKRGLLEYAFTLPDRSPEYRYAYHEVIEEAQHSLMFQEFVNRSGLEAPGLTWDVKFVPAVSCTRCSSGSCASMSPRKRAISPSRVSTCARMCRSCRA
jgi:hypothetical protein